MAARAVHAGKSVLEETAVQVAPHLLVDKAAPETVPLLEPLLPLTDGMQSQETRPPRPFLLSFGPPVFIPAEVARPQLEGAIEWSRLFARLDSARKRPIVWLDAPPGAGKTVLAAREIVGQHLLCAT